MTYAHLINVYYDRRYIRFEYAAGRSLNRKPFEIPHRPSSSISTNMIINSSGNIGKLDSLKLNISTMTRFIHLILSDTVSSNEIESHDLHVNCLIFIKGT